MDKEELESLADSLIESQRLLILELGQKAKDQGLTRDVIAERMGVKASTVYNNFERYDGNPTFSMFRRYAMAVECYVDYVVTPDLALTKNTE